MTGAASTSIDELLLTADQLLSDPSVEASAAGRHRLVVGLAVACGVVAVLVLAMGLGLLLASRRDRQRVVAAPVSARKPIRS